MLVTVDSPFVASPRCSERTFARVLAEAGSPWASLAVQLYDLIEISGHDPAVWLAICSVEHSYATNRDSVLWRNDTRSWTNARTVRHPGLSGWLVVTDAVRGSRYVKYASVEDSLRDGMYRITDPTYRYAKEGRTTIRQVIEIWSEGDGPQYAAKVAALINAYAAMDGDMTPVTAEIPGFTWHPADTKHYTRGRTEKIRGGAQHYTAGTNSLNWLSTTSNPPVSVHFLVHHQPTLDDRGCQLVRIEDTAWTTAFANPYTVAIEYEHDGRQSIPDIAYEVMAQTWADITRYVERHGLGKIDQVKGHKEWVGNPALVCPDGIDVARIERRRREILKASETPAGPPKWIIPGNPYGAFGFMHGFRDTVEKLARAKYPADLNASALSIVGYPMEDEYAVTSTRSQQACERAVLIWDGEEDAPFDVVLQLRGDL